MKVASYKHLLIVPYAFLLRSGGFSVEIDIIKNWGESTAVFPNPQKFESKEAAVDIGIQFGRAIDDGAERS